MPKFHIIAIGPPASGKSQLIRHFYNNLPPGYKLKKGPIATETSFGNEHWFIEVEKKREHKNAKHR